MNDQRPFLSTAPTPAMPAWLIHLGFVISSACILAGQVFFVLAFYIERNPHSLWGYVGAGFGCTVGGLGSFLGTYNTLQMQRGAVHIFHRLRRTYMDVAIAIYALIGLGFLGVGLVFLATDASWVHAYGSLLLASITLLQVGMYAIFRWSVLRRSRAIFSLYLDGALSPEETEAIDRARDAHPPFDEMIREFDEINRDLRDWAKT